MNRSGALRCRLGDYADSGEDEVPVNLGHHAWHQYGRLNLLRNDPRLTLEEQGWIYRIGNRLYGRRA